MYTLPTDAIERIGSHVENPARLRQTARMFQHVDGSPDFQMLEGHWEAISGLESSCLYRTRALTGPLIQAQLLHAVRTRFLEIKLLTRSQGENCQHTFDRINRLLRHVSRKISVLKLNVLGPQPPFTVDVLVRLFQTVLDGKNTIQALQMSIADPRQVTLVLQSYPTLRKIKILFIFLPDVLINNPGSVASPNWLPNRVREAVVTTLQGLPPDQHKKLQHVEIRSQKGSTLANIDGMQNQPFSFTFTRTNSERQISGFKATSSPPI